VISRRSVALAALGAALAPRSVRAQHRDFTAAAFRMREQAVAAGDQAYGAVVVRNGEIVGWGPSRVRQNGAWEGHAEREAMRDAQRGLGREDLSECVMYSTSHPCDECRRVAARAKLARMYYGPDATDAGTP
jgi:tRNA(Arg) A34 adenosine deaminase TadA